MSERRLQVAGGLSLPARIAAARFVTRRRIRSPRGEAWRPLALRWRSHRTRRPRARAGTTATTLTAIWQPLLHVHFNTIVNRLERLIESVATTPVSIARQARRSVLTHVWLHRRPADAPRGSLDFNRTAPSVSTRTLLSGAPYLAPRLPARRSPVSIRTANARSGKSPQRSQLFERQVSVVRRVFLDDPVSPMRARRHPGGGGSVERTAAGESARALPAGFIDDVTSIRAHRAVDLSWRSAARPTTPPTVEERRASGTRAFVGDDRTANESAATPVITTTDTGAPPVVERAPFDAVLLDRLTDDVIRRVERRVRIERERRGL